VDRGAVRPPTARRRDRIKAPPQANGPRRRGNDFPRHPKGDRPPGLTWISGRSSCPPAASTVGVFAASSTTEPGDGVSTHSSTPARGGNSVVAKAGLRFSVTAQSTWKKSQASLVETWVRTN
jgi:hypothetical protein